TLGSGSTLSKNFNVGTHTVTLTVTDDDGASDDDTVVITVNPYVPGAHDPSIDSMSLTPSNPTKFQDITCSASVSDADGNLNSIEFKWFVDGSNVRTQLKGVSGSFATSSDVLPSSFTDYNDIVRCEAKVSDSTSRTDTEIRSVTIRPETPVNTPPTISGIPDQPVQVGQTISQIDLYNYASDAQNSDNEMTYTIQSESNTGVIDCYITGGHYVACGNGLQAGYSDVTVRVTDTGSLYDTDTFRITVTSVPTGYEPVIESFVITPANPDTNNDIDCTVLASDDDGDLDRAVFRWYRNGQQVGSAVTKTLSGYLDSEYVILSSSSTNPGDVIRCDVTVYDDNSNTDTDSRSVTVQSAPADNPPYIDSLLIIPQNPTSQNDLTCRVSASDPNGDLDRVDFLWYRNGQQIGSTVTKSMTGYNDYETDVISSSQTADGDIIQCRTVVYDDNSNSVLWSTSVIIGSNPPENNAPTVYADLLPQNPLSSQSLTCSGIADDYDGDLDRMVFEWTIPNRLGSTVIRSNTVPIAGAIDIGDDVLSSSYTQEGDLVTCRIVAYDDENLYGSDSASVYVQTSQPGNQPPVALFYAYPTSIYEGDQVMFDADSSYDIDGSVVSYYFDFGDGSNSGWTSIDHVYHTYNIQGTYTTRVRVRDDDSSDSAWSSTAAIVVIRETNPPTGDHDPVIDNIYIRPPAPEENDDLECHVSVYDSDGDIDRILIRWYVDGGLKRTRNIYDSGSRATVYDTFDEHYTTYDDDVRCVATVYDHNGNTDEESYTVMIDDYYKPSCYPSCNICPTCTTGNCGVSIKSFDFSRNTNANKLSWAEVGVLNSGSRNANLELKVTVDGSVKGVYTVYMASGSEISRHFDFGLEEGRHDLKIDAKMDCGSTDSETGVIYVGETTPGFVPGEEYVDIYPRDMQMDAFSTGQIYIEMNSPSEQTFTINVGGMDESWLHYDNDVEVRGKRTEKIVLTPKGSGTYNLNIVVSSESGKTFRKDVKVYVNDYEEDAARRFLPLASGAAGAATLTGNYIVTGLSLWGAGNIIMSFIALLLLILIIYLLYRRHKTDDSYNEQPRYSPEMAEAVDQDREFFSNYPYYRQNGMESQRY
ncbi:MAG: PKD domain-containing protein, partial [Candidatus Aenigmarchaeota archaeon]|nr:PKD domain-containing protein [Candidatus Aenigmarchaeota archaeon]